MTDLRCYSQTGTYRWSQEWYETSSRDAQRRARELRALGYIARCASGGFQITEVGRIKMTLISIGPGQHEDLADLPQPHRVGMDQRVKPGMWY